MAITLSDFNNIWASSSPLTPYSFTDANYKEGWNFIGSTPPSRQMWDFLQKNNDEKAKYIVDNYLALSGGTMTGNITGGHLFTIKNETDDDTTRMFGGSSYNKGAYLQLFGKDHTYAGQFSLIAHDGVNQYTLNGKPDGTLVWEGKTVITKGTHIQAGKTSSTTVNANSNANVNITFSPSFASNSPVVIATADTGYTGLFVAVGSISSSGATLIINNVSSTSRSVVVCWVAIDI